VPAGAIRCAPSSRHPGSTTSLSMAYWPLVRLGAARSCPHLRPTPRLSTSASSSPGTRLPRRTVATTLGRRSSGGCSTRTRWHHATASEVVGWRLERPFATARSSLSTVASPSSNHNVCPLPPPTPYAETSRPPWPNAAAASRSDQVAVSSLGPLGAPTAKAFLSLPHRPRVEQTVSMCWWDLVWMACPLPTSVEERRKASKVRRSLRHFDGRRRSKQCFRLARSVHLPCATQRRSS
jgi:hypothetical protein